MIRLTKITDHSSQSFNLRGEAGETILMSLRYLPRQKNWVFDLVFNDLVLRGVVLVNGPNIMRAYRKNISFGILCTSIDGFDPAYLDDFINSRVNLYLLSPAEVLKVEEDFFSV